MLFIKQSIFAVLLHLFLFSNLHADILFYYSAAILPAILSTKVSKIHINQNAFNKFDDSTFAASTCVPLPIEIPMGIFASPDGTPQGAGTETDPLDLATAANNNKVQDGDTLWLMEGVYKGTFTSELRGSEDNPISVKPYPGKYVAIDTTYATSGSGLLINGTWTNYYGIEVTSYNGNRVSTIDNSSNPSDITLRAGVNIIGSTNKVINFVSHDNVSGIDAWSKRKDGFTGIDTETMEVLFITMVGVHNLLMVLMVVGMDMLFTHKILMVLKK